MSLIYEVNCYVGGEPRQPSSPRRGWLRPLVLPAPDPAAPVPTEPTSYASV